MLTPQIFTSVIKEYLPQPHAALLNGMIFGTPVRSNKILYEALKHAGLLHLVVLSGMNITLLASIIASTTSFLGKKTSIILTIIAIIFFILFVGPQPPVVRAGVMGIISLIAILYGRKRLSLYSLFIAALITSIFWPKWIANVSFLLSYSATLGIILFGTAKEPDKKASVNGLWQGLKREFRISLAAQIFTAPLIFIYFKQISLISPFANVLVAWTVAPIMILGLLAAILGKISFYLGFIPAQISYLFLSYIVFIVENLSKVPFTFFSFN